MIYTEPLPPACWLKEFRSADDAPLLPCETTKRYDKRPAKAMQEMLQKHFLLCFNRSALPKMLTTIFSHVKIIELRSDPPAAVRALAQIGAFSGSKSNRRLYLQAIPLAMS